MVISVLGDEHCLFRSVGGILRIEPGMVMEDTKAHMISMPSDEMFYVPKTETNANIKATH